jgi:aminoglycoside 6'-N-acetyltransferase
MANDDFPELTDLMRDIRILPMDREASTTRPTSACGYGFVPVQREHLPLLRQWLEAPHVSKWWGNADHEIDLIEEGLGLSWVESFLATLDGRPFAYIQAYDVHAEPAGEYVDQPPGCWGVDPFIGEAHMIGIGHGSAMLRAFVDRLFALGRTCALIDPDPTNLRAVNAYRRAGFAPVEERQTDCGPVLVMRRHAADRLLPCCAR